ncbi:unnamed protein product [marine sediment metagenome]|uniref:Uncharacterized protein n=1 Tax=marine sediment metagenome TaxID=412755 RepID=X1BNG3_9ZZZZ
MFNSEAIEIRIAFSIPQWFPPTRLDYTKSHYNPEGHVYAGSFDHSTYHNSAEDNLFNRFKDMKEICSNYWITFEYDGNPEQLTNWMKTKQEQLNRFFNQYKEAKGDN